jgi:nucleoside-diphosphate-sugar epimerase
MKSSKILVTGGAGFIGSHLVKKLLSEGCSVVVLDSFLSGRLENLSGFSGKGGFEVVEGDVRDRKTVEKALDGVDAVAHLAALIDPADSVHRPLLFHDVNVTGTVNVLKACVEKRVEKFVFASSAAVYGDGNPLPLREECELRPVSPYAASKVSGEYYCKTFSSCYGLGCLVLRLFNAYGPGQGENQYAGVLTKFVKAGLRGETLKITGDGCQTRDFVNIDDIVVAFVKALKHLPMKGEVLNVCTGAGTSINSLAKAVCGILGKDLQILHVAPREGDVLDSYGDPEQAEKVLGFKTQIELREGLERYLKSVT